MQLTNSNRNVLKAHMINLLVVANIDGKESKEEIDLIGKIAVDFGLTIGEFEECMQLAERSMEEGKLLYEVPETDEQKSVFLKNLALMMMIDGKIDENEKEYIKLVAERYGYDGDKALEILMNTIYEDFKNGTGYKQDAHGAVSDSQSQEVMGDEEFEAETRRYTALGKQALMKHDINTAFHYLMIPAHVDAEAQRLFLMIINTYTRLYLLNEEQVAELKAMAEKGYAVSQYAYGRYLYIVRPNGDSVKEADNYFKEAEKAGVSDAIQAQSSLMRDGHYDLVDIDEVHKMTLDAIGRNSELAARVYLRRWIFGDDYLEADPQRAINLIKKMLGDNESDDISEVNPMYYEILGDAYEKLGDKEKAEVYYLKAINMGYFEAYGSYCCLFNDENGTEELLDKYVSLLDAADKYLDPTCYVYKAAFLMENYDDFESEDQEKVTNNIKFNLEKASRLGSTIASYFLGNAYYYGNYGFEEDNDKAWDWFIEGSNRDECYAYSMLAQMIIDGNNPYEVSDDLVYYCQLMALRNGDSEQLRSVVEAYRNGELTDYAAEIERYYIPRYEDLPEEDDEEEEEEDEEDDDDNVYKLIAIVKTDGTADILEFDVEEGWDELPDYVGAKRLDAIRTQPLYDISTKFGLKGHITGWVDNMGLMKDLMMNPIGCTLYPGPIAGDMILTMEDEKYNPKSFESLNMLKKVLAVLGAKLDRVDLDDGPDDDGRYDAWA